MWRDADGITFGHSDRWWLGLDSTCLSAAWHSRKLKLPIAVLFNTSPRTRAGLKVEEVAHEAPWPSRVLDWLLGRERGCCDTKENNASALVCPQGLFYQKFQPRQYPVLCISPQLGLFLPGSTPMSRARLQSVACVHAPEQQKPREFDARCHVRSRLRVEPERPVSQSVGRQSVILNTCRCHAMLLKSAVSLLIVPY